jgi:hypothetical protein
VQTARWSLTLLSQLEAVAQNAYNLDVPAWLTGSGCTDVLWIDGQPGVCQMRTGWRFMRPAGCVIEIVPELMASREVSHAWTPVHTDFENCKAHHRLCQAAALDRMSPAAQVPRCPARGVLEIEHVLPNNANKRVTLRCFSVPQSVQRLSAVRKPYYGSEQSLLQRSEARAEGTQENSAPPTRFVCGTTCTAARCAIKAVHVNHIGDSTGTESAIN